MVIDVFRVPITELEKEIQSLKLTIEDKKISYELSDKSEKYNPILEERKNAYSIILALRKQ